MIDEWPEAELEELAEWLIAARRSGGLVMQETRVTDEEVENDAPAKPISFEELKRMLDEAPLDDEPETEEELEALRHSLASNGDGRMSHEDVKKLIGL